MVEKAKGKPITTYQPFCNMWKETLRKAPVTLAPDVTSIPPLSPAALKQASSGGLDVPQLAALGYKDADATSPFKGGEKEGLKRLRRYMLRTDWVARFEKPKSAPPGRSLRLAQGFGGSKNLRYRAPREPTPKCHSFDFQPVPNN